ncbi:hypothetical protein B0H11DRAFT_1834229 [Mycena galericulata]|nr:hypothetical protein B0H11DRAFT_1834229 [Mycena galericulata]
MQLDRTQSALFFVVMPPRLQRLELVLYQHQFSRLEDMGPFPLLEELRISLPYNSFRDGAGPVLRPRIFDHTPRLKHLILGENASPSKFRLSYLSKFTCDRLAADEFFDLLRDAPFLEDCDCQVYVLPSIMSSTTGTQVVTHARLRTIRFRHSSTQILRLLRLPALENLDFQSRHEFTESHVDYLIPFLACSSASLRRFCIDTGSDPDPRVEWFSSLPGLTHVMVHNAGKEFSSAFFSKLDRAQDIGFLPRSQSLAFEEFFFPQSGPPTGPLTDSLPIRTFHLNSISSSLHAP